MPDAAEQSLRHCLREVARLNAAVEASLGSNPDGAETQLRECINQVMWAFVWLYRWRKASDPNP